MKRQAAWRRAQADRIRRRRLEYWSGQIGHHWETPRPCSCPMCGNPRRHFGELTVQERRAIEAEMCDRDEIAP